MHPDQAMPQSYNPDYAQMSASFIQGPSFKPGVGTTPPSAGQVLTSTPYRGYQQSSQPLQQPLQQQQQPLQQPQQPLQQPATVGE